MGARRINGTPVTDGRAIHVNVAQEIEPLTEKVTFSNPDRIILEDAADFNNKKSGQVGNINYDGGYF